jgi:peptide-methionine (S)-S-oxide reductase
MTDEAETAVLAGGCSWIMQELLRDRDGVISTRVGWTGGENDNPTEENNSGHAEAVEVVFDPDEISYDELLDVFWAEHDPTQRNRQGPDVGTQYRSAVFFHSPEQERAARASLARRQAQLSRPIATEIESASRFWPAEDYHQQFYEKRGMAPVCKVGAHASAG